MSEPLVIPNDSTFDAVTFDVLSNGNIVSPEIQIISITVNKEVNRIPRAFLMIRDGDASDSKFSVSDGDFFVPGSPIEIKTGHDGENSTIFKGLVVKQQVKIKEKGISTLLVTCKDKAVKLTVGRKNRYFIESKDSEIIEEILDQNGLDADIDPTPFTHKEVVQHYALDWDFILNRAEQNGKLVIVDDGIVSVKAPDTSQTPVLTLLYGATIIEFDAEMDASSQWKAVVAKSWDYGHQTLFESETSSVPYQENGNISGEEMSEVLGLETFDLRHSGQVLPEELQSWTDSFMLKSRMAKIAGTVKFNGFGGVKPGSLLVIQGVGDRFNGPAFVTAVRQELVDGAWFTYAQFGYREATLFKKEDGEISAAGLLTGVSGLQIGKVVQLQDDPDGEDRILIKLPIIDMDADGIWARLASLDAGENRGSFFRPEIDDEVIVGFVNDDPRDAVVLGMLNSSAKPAPISASDDNHEKGFVTRSEMKLLFKDDKKEILIETPAGNSILISEDSTSIVLTDQNNNTITMDASGIAFNSPGDIIMEASGAINIKATGDLSMEGMNVSAKANAEFKAEGQAGAKLTTSAIAEIKGSLVKIN